MITRKFLNCLIFLGALGLVMNVISKNTLESLEITLYTFLMITVSIDTILLFKKRNNQWIAIGVNMAYIFAYCAFFINRSIFAL